MQKLRRKVEVSKLRTSEGTNEYADGLEKDSNGMLVLCKGWIQLSTAGRSGVQASEPGSPVLRLDRSGACVLRIYAGQWKHELHFVSKT